MIRYNYNRQCTPPATFVHVLLRCPVTSKDTGELPAQLDTAAHRTVIPWHGAEELVLVPIREIRIASFSGQITSVPTFLIQVTIRQLRPINLEVLASRGEPYVLLGRDILNLHHVILDGPKLAFAIS